MLLVLPAQLATQAEHGELDPLGADAEGVVPDLLEQLLGGEGLAGMPDERLEELELELGEADHLAVDPDLAGRPVDLEVAVAVDGRLLGSEAGAAAWLRRSRAWIRAPSSWTPNGLVR